MNMQISVLLVVRVPKRMQSNKVKVALITSLCLYGILQQLSVALRAGSNVTFSSLQNFITK